MSARRDREILEAQDHAAVLLTTEREPEAFEFLGEAVKQFPDDAKLHLLFASILLLFRPEDVVAEASLAVDLGHDDPGILVRAGHLVFSRGEIELARDWARRANEVADPDFLQRGGLENLYGRLAVVDGERDVAESWFRSAVKRDPAFPSFAEDLAQFLKNQGRTEEALKVVDNAIAQVGERDNLKKIRDELVDSSGV
jgi:tetratricopeptide (TPR) repeat protein